MAAVLPGACNELLHQSQEKKKGTGFWEKPMCSGGSSYKVGTIPILHGSDGLRPPWRQAKEEKL